MKKIGCILAAGLLIALGVWLYHRLFPSDERQLRALLAAVAKTASFKPNENPLVQLAAAGKLAGFFSDDAAIHIDVPGLDGRTIQGRAELEQIIAAARASVQSVEIRFPDAQLEIDAGRQSASGHLAVVADINGEKDAAVQELKLSFRKIDRQWKIAQIDTVRTLRMTR